MKVLSVFIFFLLICLSLFTGCALRSLEKKSEEQGVSERVWSPPDYSDFVERNIKNINQLYTEEYGPYYFIADTSKGSTVVQNLIDRKLAEQQLNGMRFGHLNAKEKILSLHQYVLHTYRYFVEPNIWPTIHETLEWKKGDCKGLSLLLMSLLLASGIETYAAVSNGHMWVNVNVEGKWQVLELDRDPDRTRIYTIPGFYELPLFKIYEDQTQKRLRKKND